MSSATRQSELLDLYNRYKGGLEKMAETEESVAVIQEELRKLQPVLAQKVKGSINISTNLAGLGLIVDQLFLTLRFLADLVGRLLKAQR